MVLKKIITILPGGDFGHIPDPFTIDKINPEILVYHTEEEHIFSVKEANKYSALASISSFINQQDKPEPLLFLTHGFNNSIDEKWLNKIKNAIIENNPKTFVFILGWGDGAKLINSLKVGYTQAVANTQVVGKWLGNVVEGITRQLAKPAFVYGVGHSLGAHVMGCAGRTSGAFSRITGLDPAGPSFEKKSSATPMLSKSDAKFVDIIHTDGYEQFWFSPPVVEIIQQEYEKCLMNPVNHYGTMKPMGHVDFYPNFGLRQPKTGLWSLVGSKSHSRAFELFIASIKHPGQFETDLEFYRAPEVKKKPKGLMKRGNSVQMGYYCDSNSKGSFYLKTTATYPYFAL